MLFNKVGNSVVINTEEFCNFFISKIAVTDPVAFDAYSVETFDQIIKAPGLLTPLTVSSNKRRSSRYCPPAVCSKVLYQVSLIRTHGPIDVDQ